MALEQANEILKVVPETAGALHIKASACRMLGQTATALEILLGLEEKYPAVASIHRELGLVFGANGNSDRATRYLRQAVELDPSFIEGWRSLAEQYDACGMEEERDAAYAAHLKASATNPETAEAVRLFSDGALHKAEELARSILKKDPMNVTAIRVLADIGLKVGRFEDAQNLLERCLELAPTFSLARHSYAIALFRRHKFREAVTELDTLLKSEPGNPSYLILKGSALVQKGDHQAALEIYEALVKKYPKQVTAQMNFGHTLKSVGRIDEAVAAYRACITVGPSIGEAYWSLANLKTFRFTDADINMMLSRLEEDKVSPDERTHLEFALGKAYEDRQDYDQSFQHYAKGNAIRKKKHRYDPRRNVYDSARQIHTLTQEFFETRKGWGHTAPDPIFVVGLPRAGSTLIEQILSSHSLVEGTAELTDIIAMSRKLGGKERLTGPSKYPEILEDVTEEQALALGQDYIRTTMIQRHGSPFFIDKMPNNFLHVGLIHMILPNAKIIDARRHPMAGCFAGYKQLFARGQTFTYSLEDIGHYYRDYVKVMDHWDSVLPGRVHRVQYEDMVDDTENQIRRLLDYCGLPFEEGCLKFYETKRAIRTPSSEQVRQPVYKDALELWRHYEANLDPLKEALGPLLDRYPI
ncbi:hypothetical protein GCM10017044_18420 [Kordiimonas sediminis]|uniref:Sulfotransferase family protein n=2 Tax=Kordiimonas sediminis TaxID=1735581 RepID=A0A919ASJ6_9PROT|nr:hypothetical protein GCM10017044_18420 [Kordiimonas sediminis]